MESTNNQIAKIFSRIADSLEILDENSFKINAYRKASRNISSMSDSLEEFDGEKELSTIPGVGKDLSKKIIEHRLTGKIAYHEEMKKAGSRRTRRTSRNKRNRPEISAHLGKALRGKGY